MSKRIAPSVELEAQLEELLSEGVADGERLSEVGRLGARLVLQQRRGWRASYTTCRDVTLYIPAIGNTG